MRTVPVLPKTRPSADCAALRFTVCAVLTVEMLKLATSDEPGGRAGSGVAALLEVDQLVLVFHPPGLTVPSQKMVAAGAAVGEKAVTRMMASVSDVARCAAI